MDTQDLRTPRRRVPGALLVGAGVVAGIALAGFGVASAQPGDPTPNGSEGGTTAAAPRHPGGPGGRGHRGGGPGMGIHGEFVTADPDGGYQTIATQVGEVTAVSATSITVRSEDGFSRTYAVDDGTLVNAGNEGIDDVEQGDDVHVMATVEDGGATAVRVNDKTRIGELKGRWMPARPAPAASPTA